MIHSAVNYVILIQNYSSKSVDITVKLESLRELETSANNARLMVRDIQEGKNLGKLGNGVHLKGIKVDQVKVLVLSKP